MRVYAIITHIAGWILFLSLPTLFVANQSGGHDFWLILFSLPALLFCITYLGIFYLHTDFLIPRFYSRKKWFLYYTSLLVLLLSVWALQPFDRLMGNMPPRSAEGFDNREPPVRPGPPPRQFSDTLQRPFRERPPGGPFRGNEAFKRPDGPPFKNGRGKRNTPFVDIISIFLFIIIMIISLAMHFLSRLRLAEQHALQADADKAYAELSFLKAQINPHFLFNTLNNIYSLAASKSEHTAESIMKLSNIMRYVTDDVANNFVPLENEVEFIHDYIDLQRLRLGKKMKVTFLVSGMLQNKKIAPLILITFIENVFKYGISNHENTDINIEITATEKDIIFFCQNRIFVKARNYERKGIGIANTRERLEHLYPDKYFLKIDTENEKFSVQLTLQV